MQPGTLAYRFWGPTKVEGSWWTTADRRHFTRVARTVHVPRMNSNRESTWGADWDLARVAAPLPGSLARRSWRNPDLSR